MRSSPWFVLAVLAAGALAVSGTGSATGADAPHPRRHRHPPPVPSAPPPVPVPPAAVPCAGPGPQLSPLEAQQLASRASMVAGASPSFTIAVVDRLGDVLALLRRSASDTTLDDRAIGLARTGAFFSNDQAPLSS